MEETTGLMAALALLAVVAVLPIISHRAEEWLEGLIVAAGVVAVTVSNRWSAHLVVECLKDPLAITGAVLVAGALFKWFQPWYSRAMTWTVGRLGTKATVCLVLTVFGLASSLLTAVIASSALVEAVRHLRLSRQSRSRVTIMGCFAIGLGAILTPLGEPLSSIIQAKLSASVHPPDFGFLFRQTAFLVIPLVLVLGWVGSRFAERDVEKGRSLGEADGTWLDLITKTIRIYVFVAGLILFGSGMEPLAGRLISSLPDWGLYWVNAASAVLDNATLAAAEINPGMSEKTLRFAIFGLMISGGMLVQGNLPNIICAKQLKIGAKEWASFGLPMGAVIMAVSWFFWLWDSVGAIRPFFLASKKPFRCFGRAFSFGWSDHSGRVKDPTYPFQPLRPAGRSAPRR